VGFTVVKLPPAAFAPPVL